MHPFKNMTGLTTINSKTSCWVTGLGNNVQVLLLAVKKLVYKGFQDLIAKDPNTHGSFFIPIILGSDKTTVSVAMGNNKYYLVYLSIGNIHNNVQHAHCDGITIIAFLVLSKSEFL